MPKTSSHTWYDLMPSPTTLTASLKGSEKMSEEMESYILNSCNALLRQGGCQVAIRISIICPEEGLFQLERSLLVDGKVVPSPMPTTVS